MRDLLKSKLQDEVPLEFYDPVSYFKMGGKPYTLIDLGDVSVVALGFKDLHFAISSYKQYLDSLVFVGSSELLVDFLKAYCVEGNYNLTDIQSILNKDRIILDEVDFTTYNQEIMWIGHDKVFLHIKDAVVKLNDSKMSDEFIDFLKKNEKFPLPSSE